jgi:hypothetical protein
MFDSVDEVDEDDNQMSGFIPMSLAEQYELAES